MRYAILIVLLMLLISGCSAQKKTVVSLEKNDSILIPRDLLFGNPDKITIRISPDGSMISFLAPLNGVLNIWVGPALSPDKAGPITNDTHRGIRSYSWSYANDHIIYIQDKGGDENWRIYGVNLSSGEVKDLTPFEGVQAQILASSPKFPEELIIGLNKRNPEYHDLYRLNIKTGNMTLLLENRNFSSFSIDDDFNVRLASDMTDDGGIDVYQHEDNGTWKMFMRIPMEDSLTTGFAGFNKTNQIIYMSDSRGRDTNALFELDLKTGEKRLLAADPKSDGAGYMSHPTEKNIQGAAFCYERLNWTVLDPAIAGDMKYLAELEEGDIGVVSRSLDDKTWIVVFTKDDSPARYYYYDHEKKNAHFLFTDRKQLEDKPLSRMIPVVIKSRDGLDMVSFYTLPKNSDPEGDGRPVQPLPMVLLVHGGPWSRDYWGLDKMHQWLANRGYAVLAVNFRGSTGFGKNFTNAGNLEWGAKMQEDLIDGVSWAVQNKIADPDKVAIMGGSYGGYATLAGLTFTPETFACGVDIVGPSNLTSLLLSIPPYWKPELEQDLIRVGDYRTEDGRKLLRERSPLTHVEKIARPLLIGQGANDPRVKQNESDQIVKAMQDKNLPVTYVLYGDEGHGFVRPENRLSFYAIAESFLAEHLGGRYEPIGKDFQGANFTVPAGIDEVPGLRLGLEDT
jgi:dipeptidyl aminopeptidase/acylaminoacyl peptidase